MHWLELHNLRLILKIKVSIKITKNLRYLIFGLTLSVMKMPFCRFEDYMCLLKNEQFVATLYEKFVDV